MNLIYEDISQLLSKEIGESLEIKKEIRVNNLGNERVKIKSPIFLEINFILTARGEVEAEFKIKADLEFSCDRCLKKFTKETKLNFSQTYRAGGRRYQEDSREEEILPILADQKVEVFEPARQEILTSMPYRILCHEKCPGVKYWDNC